MLRQRGVSATEDLFQLAVAGAGGVITAFPPPEASSSYPKVGLAEALWCSLPSLSVVEAAQPLRRWGPVSVTMYSNAEDGAVSAAALPFMPQ